MSDKTAQARKRQASASLRAVAAQLQIGVTRRHHDMSRADFQLCWQMWKAIAGLQIKGVALRRQKLNTLRLQVVTSSLPLDPYFFGSLRGSLPSRYRVVTAPTHDLWAVMRVVTGSLPPDPLFVGCSEGRHQVVTRSSPPRPILCGSL